MVELAELKQEIDGPNTYLENRKKELGAMIELTQKEPEKEDHWTNLHGFFTNNDDVENKNQSNVQQQNMQDM